MALYAIGDTHLSLGSDKPMDVCGGGWAGYVDKLRRGFEEVRPEDTVVLCGDMNNAGVILASRNLPNVKVIQAQNLNTYDVMNAAHLLVGGEGAVAAMQQVCGIQ